MSWASRARANRRRDRCKWFFSPKVYRVRIDDAYYQQRYEAAAEEIGTALGMGLNMDLPAFFLFSAEYVYHHHRQLTAVRARLRKRDREAKRRRPE